MQLHKKVRLLMRGCFLAVLLAALSSCGSSTIQTQGTNGPQRFNVELKAGSEVDNQCAAEPKKLRSIPTAVEPVYLPPAGTRGGRYIVWALGDCQDPQKRRYEISADRIARITEVASPVTPPTPRAPKTEECEECKCCRRRNADFLSFNKIELRGMIGYRGTDEQNYIHQGPDGPEEFPSSFINFDEGGSNLVLGLETAFLWDLDDDSHVQLGPFIGYWPIDGSQFIPVAAHLRYTFNPNPDTTEYLQNCKTPYVFAQLGMPVDFQTNAPYLGPDFDRQRYFYTLGIGYEWDVNCDMDFALDIGFRTMNNPLPEIECCDDVPDDERNAYRKSSMIFLRAGVTF